MRALIILLVLSQATARGGRGGGRGGSSRGSSRGSSSRGSWFSWGSRSRSSGYSTSSSTYSTSSRSYQSPSYQKTRQRELDRQKLAESYAYGGENWGKRPNSKPKVPAVIPVVLTGSSHSHTTGNTNHDGSNSEKSSMSKYAFGTSSFSVSSVWLKLIITDLQPGFDLGRVCFSLKLSGLVCVWFEPGSGLVWI